MNMFRKIILILSIILSKSLVANKNSAWSLAMGVGSGVTSIQADGQKRYTLNTYGIHTQVGIQMQRWGIYFAQFLNYPKVFGRKIQNFRVKAHDSIVTGNALYHSIYYAFKVRYISSWAINLLERPFHFYVVGGVLNSLHTIKFKSAMVESGLYQYFQKITFDSRGGMLGLGIQEVNLKAKHPIFVEFLLSKHQPYQEAVVAGTKIKMDIIRRGRPESQLREITAIIQIGLKVF